MHWAETRTHYIRVKAITRLCDIWLVSQIDPHVRQKISLDLNILVGVQQQHTRAIPGTL